MVTELFPEVPLYAVNPFPGGKQKVLMRQDVVATISVAWQKPSDFNHPMESGMSHQDTDGHTGSLASSSSPEAGARLAFGVGEALGSGVSRGDCSWSPKALIFTAILWAWSDEKSLTERFFLARKVVMAMAILGPRMPATTYQAFLKMLKTWTVVLTIALVVAFRQRMQTDLADRFKVCGFAVFGVDGSRLELPRTAVQRGAVFARQGATAVETEATCASRIAGRVRERAATAAHARRRRTVRRCG